MNASVSIPTNFCRRIIRPMKGRIASLALPVMLAASALHGKLNAEPRITVCVERAAEVEEEVLERGEISASKILALVGLKIEWRNLRRSCPQERDPIILNVTTNTPRDYFPRAYGTALAFEGTHIRVFYDRIQGIRPDQVVPVLGHVFAHEIVHILSGTDSHSETGVMKRRWSQSDLQEMITHPLPFSETDILLLNLGIRGRHARLATKRAQAALP